MNFGQIKSLGVLLVIALLLALTPAFGQDEAEEARTPEEMADAFTVEFNRVLREQFDTRALARSDILDGVATEIAEQVGCTNNRIDFDIQLEAELGGYRVYPGDNEARTTRIPLIPAVNIRPIEDMASLYAAGIFENNINQPSRFYREIGVGVSPCIAVQGPDAIGSTEQYGLFIVLGSQPDVIPVVIENGGSTIEVDAVPARVELSIHSENSRQREDIFGSTASVRLSNSPIDDDTPSSLYTPAVLWALEECGENTVYYELTDEAGLIIEGSTSVDIVCGDAS
jgi:hypothetical protein